MIIILKSLQNIENFFTNIKKLTLMSLRIIVQVIGNKYCVEMFNFDVTYTFEVHNSSSMAYKHGVTRLTILMCVRFCLNIAQNHMHRGLRPATIWSFLAYSSRVLDFGNFLQPDRPVISLVWARRWTKYTLQPSFSICFFPSN